MNNNLTAVKFRIFSVLCCLMVIICSACSSTTPPENNTTIETKTISFAWWGNDDRHQYTMEAVDQFEALNPSINVKCQYGSWSGYPKRMHIYMKSLSAPDVMQINSAWIDEYSNDGNGFYNLNELSDYIDLSNFTEADLEFGMVNGKLNAIPIALNTQTIYYNKTIFDQYGLDIPKTWDDFFDAAKVMQKDNIYPLGMVNKSLFFFLTAYLEQTKNKEPYDENGNLNLTEEDIQYMIEFYKKLIDEKVLMPVDDFDRNIFSSGKTAGTMAWISDAGSYCNPLIENGNDVVIGDYPMAKNAKTLGWYIKPATLYAISNKTESPKASAALLNYLLNSEEMAKLQGTEKGIPLSKNAVAVLESENLMESTQKTASDKMLENREQMKIMKPIMENDEVLDTFKKGSDFYLYDKKDLETCAHDIYELLKKY